MGTHTTTPTKPLGICTTMSTVVSTMPIAPTRRLMLVNRWKRTMSTITRTRRACDRENPQVQAPVSPWRGRRASSATAPLTASQSRRLQRPPQVFKRSCGRLTAWGDFPSMGLFLNAIPTRTAKEHQRLIRTPPSHLGPARTSSRKMALDSTVSQGWTSTRVMG